MELELKKLYHFVAKEKMKKKIFDYLKILKLNFSKTMRLIIDTMIPLLDNYFIFEEDSSDFGYNEFGSEVDIKFSIDPTQHHYYKILTSIFNLIAL